MQAKPSRRPPCPQRAAALGSTAPAVRLARTRADDWEGAKTATDAYRAARAIAAPLLGIDTTAVQWQKPR